MSVEVITLPTKRGKGAQSEESKARYQRELERFALQVRQIGSTLDFKVGGRGWCYILEEHGLAKGDFDLAEKLINDCRKEGLLPIPRRQQPARPGDRGARASAGGTRPLPPATAGRVPQ